jgi:hypothetical protein
MKRALKKQPDPNLLDEYDFGKGVRGKYAERYAKGTNVVALARTSRPSFETLIRSTKRCAP